LERADSTQPSSRVYEDQSNENLIITNITQQIKKIIDGKGGFQKGNTSCNQNFGTQKLKIYRKNFKTSLKYWKTPEICSIFSMHPKKVK